MGPVPGTLLPCRTDDQVARMVAVNGTHRLPDALAPLINVRRGAEGDKQTPNVTKPQILSVCSSPLSKDWARGGVYV